MAVSRNYGYFDERSKEYVITEPVTPEPWINYLSGRNLNAFISNGAGGTAWYGQPNTGRITRYRFNGLPMDSPGFYIYVKDGELIWNPSFFPSMEKLDRYECRHGMGHVRFAASRNDIDVSVRYFIPLRDDILLQDITVENRSREAKTLGIYPYIDYSLHDVKRDTYSFCVTGNQARYRFDKKSGGLSSEYFAFEAAFPGWTIFSSSERFKKFDMDRNFFIGRGRTEANPAGLERGLSNTEVTDGGFYACGVFELPLELAPGETRRMTVKLAVDKDMNNARALSEKYDSFPEVDRASGEIDEYWKDALSKCSVETPDKNSDIMLNTWFPKNIMAAMRNGRSISHRHPGSSTSLRFRDGMQDIMSSVTLFPQEAVERILTLLRSITASGRIVYSLDPVSFAAQERPTRADAVVWGVYTLYKYLAETGDKSLFDKILPFNDKGDGSVLEHLTRGMRFVGDNTGPFGLPALFDCDWNDMLNVFSDAREGGETVMVAEQYIYAARLLVEMLEYLGKKKEEIPYFEEKSGIFTEILSSEACWDGAWFKRLLYPDAVLGSSANPEGKLFLNTQSWAVIAGTLPGDKVRKAMDSVAGKLDTEFGIRVFTPPFTKMMDNVTRFNTNVPGAGENGGLFLHANTWAVIAEAILGNPDRAWKYFTQILPNNLSSRNPDLYAREPYAFASWVYGPDHKAFGNAALNWLTGGASWMYAAGTEYLLGIKPLLKGLRISPCIPRDWEGFRVRRRVRGSEYDITVENPGKKGCGEVKLRAGNSILDTNVVPYAPPGERVDVKAVIE